MLVAAIRGRVRPSERQPAGGSKKRSGFVCLLAPLGTITYRAELDGGMTEHELVHVFRGV